MQKQVRQKYKTITHPNHLQGEAYLNNNYKNKKGLRNESVW